MVIAADLGLEKHVSNVSATCFRHLRQLRLIRVDVNSVFVFKACLDRFWMNQDVKYDFTADLTGTGDRSVNVITET